MVPQLARAIDSPSRSALLTQLAVGGLLSLLLFLTGCGTTKNTLATDQLLESDAVDNAIAAIDFRPLTGQKVFLDTKYLQDYKGVGFVNSSYIIAGIRQQIIAAGCLIQDKAEEAEFMIEGRIGALGSDRHELVYGIPQSNMLSTVGSLVPGAPPIPPIPEISLARKADAHGAAKIALIAYDRESKERVWQSGTSLARSESKNTWFMGIGPIQRGSIHRNGARFAGSRLPWQLWKKRNAHVQEGPLYAFQNAALYKDPRLPIPAAPDTLLATQPEEAKSPEAEVQQASSQQPVPAPAAETPAPQPMPEVKTPETPVNVTPPKTVPAPEVTAPTSATPLALPPREPSPLPMPEAAK